MAGRSYPHAIHESANRIGLQCIQQRLPWAVGTDDARCVGGL